MIKYSFLAHNQGNSGWFTGGVLIECCVCVTGNLYKCVVLFFAVFPPPHLPLPVPGPAISERTSLLPTRRCRWGGVGGLLPRGRRAQSKKPQDNPWDFIKPPLTVSSAPGRRGNRGRDLRHWARGQREAEESSRGTKILPQWPHVRCCACGNRSSTPCSLTDSTWGKT